MGVFWYSQKPTLAVIVMRVYIYHDRSWGKEIMVWAGEMILSVKSLQYKHADLV